MKLRNYLDMDNKTFVLILLCSTDIHMLDADMCGTERGHRERADLRCNHVCTSM